MVRSGWWRGPFSRAQGSGARPDLEASADEGELITMQAVLLGLKNRILVTTLTTNTRYEPSHFVADARQVIDELVVETRLQAAHVHAELQRAMTREGDALSASDYRRSDRANLEHRRDVLELIADRLSENATDDDWVLDLVARARDLAWAEMAREMDQSLHRQSRLMFGDENYESERAARLDEFTRLDLATLIREHESRPARAHRAGKKKRAQDAG